MTYSAAYDGHFAVLAVVHDQLPAPAGNTRGRGRSFTRRHCCRRCPRRERHCHLKVRNLPYLTVYTTHIFGCYVMCDNTYIIGLMVSSHRRAGGRTDGHNIIMMHT